MPKIKPTRVFINQQTEEVQSNKSELFGLVNWWETISSTKKGSTLYIQTSDMVDEIYINGKLIKN